MEPGSYRPNEEPLCVFAMQLDIHVPVGRIDGGIADDTGGGVTNAVLKHASNPRVGDA